jgi:signal transduction histidine kinase/DNA-binding NarL/FixJ family response regulator
MNFKIPYSKILQPTLALALPILLVVMIFTYISISAFKDDIHNQLLKNELKTVNAVTQTLVTGFKTKFEKGVFNSLNNNKKLQNNMNSVLRTLIKDKYEYAYLVYKDEKNKYRFLLDGSKNIDERAEFNQLFIAESDNWDKIFKTKQAITYNNKSTSSELWITHLEPVIIDNKIQAVLAVDFSTKDEKNILEILVKIEDALLYMTLFTIFVLTLSIVVNIINIKERKKANIANKTKSEFIANISHEIRTPMNAICGMTELMSFTKLTPKQNDLLEKITTASNTLLLLLNDILDFSKIEANKLVIDKTDFNLYELIEQINNVQKLSATTKNIDFDIIYETKIYPNLIGDPLRLNQILTNLISNGIKFTSQGGVKLIVSQTIIDNHTLKLLCKIEDTGIGIKKEFLNELFKPFDQADNSITRQYGGTGLGLAITNNLVQLQNGKIWVDSVENEGSQFCFEINLEYKHTDIKKQSATIDTIDFKEKVLNLKNINILLVEDNEINQDVIKLALEDTNVSLKIVSNGQEAVDIFKSNQFDLIIMDIQMPIMDGYTATDIIRTQNKDIPIIALSANAMVGDIKKSKQHKINQHLSKPIKMNELYKVLYKYLNHETILQDKYNVNIDTNSNFNFKHINSDDALSMINDNSSFYIQMLKKFYKKYGIKKTSIRELISSNKEKAHILVHTIKGLSGNIGAYELHKLASQLNDAILEQPQNNYENLITQYENEMDFIILELQNYFEQNSSKKDEKNQDKIENININEKLSLLIEPLENSQMNDAKKIIVDIEQYKIPTNYSEDFKILSKLIKSYKAKDALILTQRLIDAKE